MPDLLSVSPALSPASLFLGDEGQLPALIILTGPSGSGKTTFCSQLVEQARARGFVVGGLLSPPVMRAGRKVAIDLFDLHSGACHRLAVPRCNERDGLMTSGWLFAEETLTWGNECLDAMPDCSLLILDELGPLELNREQGLQVGVQLIERHHPPHIVAVIRPGLIPAAQARWPWGRVFQVGEGWLLSSAREGEK